MVSGVDVAKDTSVSALPHSIVVFTVSLIHIHNQPRSKTLLLFQIPGISIPLASEKLEKPFL